MARDVYLTGSVPLAPAASVLRTVAEHVGDLTPRIPDGEQGGWVQVARRTLAENPALEEGPRIKRSGHDPVGVPTYHLKRGLTAKDLTLGPYGYADNALESYAQFTQLRRQGVVREGTRFQFTMPGPGTSSYNIGVPAEELLPIAARALSREVEQVLANVPAEDLCCQLDIGQEAEHEEWRRRPESFDTPNHAFFDWTQDQMADAVTSVVNQIPADVEVGFHICSIWHHYQGGGQDNAVLVDTCNALVQRMRRPLAYVHIPVIPAHVEADYAALARLELPAGTKFYLGVINLADGVEGAKRRLAMAEKHVTIDGVAFFCGLGSPGATERPAGGYLAEPPNPEIRRATAETIGSVLDLHRQVAQA